MRAGGKRSLSASPSSLHQGESPRAGVSTPNRTRRDPERAAVRAAAPCASQQRNPVRKDERSVRLLAGSLPGAWSVSTGTTVTRLKAPWGGYFWVLIVLPAPALALSQRSTQASLGPKQPPGHGQPKKSALGEGRLPWSCSDGWLLAQGLWGFCSHAAGNGKGARNAGAGIPGATGTRAA